MSVFFAFNSSRMEKKNVYHISLCISQCTQSFFRPDNHGKGAVDKQHA